MDQTMTLPMFPTGPLADGKLPASLRPYQAKLIQKLRVHVVSGQARILVVAPTGAGKMFIIASIIRTATVPVLFIAHRMELIDQCARELERQGITSIGVMRADDDRTNPSASVQIASIQTLARRDKPAAGIIILDEAHRAAGDSYRDVLTHYPGGTPLFGFTASPTRLDGRPLGGDLFQRIEIAATYGELLKHPEWLVAPDIFSSPVRPDLSGVGMIGGDFDEGALGEAMAQSHLVGDVVEHWLRLAHRHPMFTPSGVRIPMSFRDGERRRTFCFAVNIKHSMMLCDRFEKEGVRVAHLDGKTPENERRAMLADMAAGKLDVISNCNVLLEGVDVPSVKCVVHARPTKSLVLWMQSTGRIMRPWNGVTPIILDHGCNFDAHGAPFEDRAWSLTERVRRIAASMPMKLCKGCFAYVEAHKLVCPFCGWEFPKEERRAPSETPEALAQRGTEPLELKRRYFESMVTLARAKGYKPGFASAKFRENYGVWPPWAWSEELREAFVSDEFWQATMTRRLEQKAARDARDAEEARHWDEVNDVAPEFEGDVPEDFATWVGEDT
jgi:superfamily II DNA or RNA helicase